MRRPIAAPVCRPGALLAQTVECVTCLTGGLTFFGHHIRLPGRSTHPAVLCGGLLVPHRYRVRAEGAGSMT